MCLVPADFVAVRGQSMARMSCVWRLTAKRALLVSSKFGEAGYRLEGRADRGNTSMKPEMNAALDSSNLSKGAHLRPRVQLSKLDLHGNFCIV